jgi:hypothetical protein
MSLMGRVEPAGHLVLEPGSCRWFEDAARRHRFRRSRPLEGHRDPSVGACFSAHSGEWRSRAGSSHLQPIGWMTAAGERTAIPCFSMSAGTARQTNP